MQQTGRSLCKIVIFFLYLETLRIAWSNTLRWAKRRDISSLNRHEAFDHSRYVIRMENPLVVGSSRRSFPGKIAARPPASYLLWPRAQGSRSEIIRCYRTACHSATVSRVPFAASSAPQIAVPETPPANQSRIMVIHRYSIVVFLAKTRRLGDDPTFLPALPAFVTKPLNVWIMVRAPMKRFMIEHRLEVSSMEQENLCNSGNENRE